MNICSKGFKFYVFTYIFTVTNFLIPIFYFIVLFILLRASIPRPRYDQVMSFSWKFCLPLTLINLLVTAALVLLNSPAAGQ